MGHQEPGEHSAAEAHGGGTDTDGIRIGRVETSLCQEVGGPADHRRAGRLLHEPGDAGDFRAAQVDTLEAVQVAGAGGLLDLELVGVDHHCKGVLNIEVLVLLRGKAEQRVAGLVDLAVTNKPPWRLGSEEGGRGDWERPDPLDGVGHTVGPLRCSGNEGLQDTSSKQLADDPAEVDVCGQVGAESDRCDLGRIGSSQGLENTPWQTRQDVACEQHIDILSKEGNEDAAHNEEQCADHGLAVADSL